MKKVPIEILFRAGENATIILPDGLSRLDILGIVEALLLRLDLPQVKIITGDNNGTEEN